MQFRLEWSPYSEKFLAVLLLLILAAELGFSARRQSQTIDEVDHIHAGYRYWQCGDFGVNPEHPPFAKLVDTIPLLFDRPKNPGPPCASYNTGSFSDFQHGIDFLYSNDAAKILAETRFFAASFTFLLAIFVFIAARRMFGGGAALVALLLLVFEPTVLAHGALVTTDLPATCWIFAAVYAFYRYTEQPTTVQMIFCGFSAGLALAAKHSSVLVLPILAILAVVDVWIRWRNSVTNPSDSQDKWNELLFRRAAALATIVITATAILWGFYLFRYSARPAGHDMTVSLWAYIQDAIQNAKFRSALLPRVIPRLTRLLPESYLYGLTNVAIQASGGRQTFLLGHLYPLGRWFYFPVAFMIKCTLGFLLLLLFAFLVSGKLWNQKKRETIFLVVPAAFYLGMSVTSRLNIGIRHILPIYPFLIVLAAAAAWQLARRSQAWAYVIVALVAVHCISSLRAFPDYLSYSNEAWGGPQETYRYLTDSNVDWGRGLIDDRNYLARNRITDCWIAYFGTADLDSYGIPCKVFPKPYLPQKRFAAIPRYIEGTLLICVTDLSGWPWGPPAENPYGPLQHVKPVANLGGHTLVFQGRFDLRLLSSASHSRLAQVAASQDQLAEALAEAQTGVEMAPERMQGHLALAQVLAKTEQFPEARTEYREAIRLAELGEPGYYPLETARKELTALDSLSAQKE
jgi:hypothetical protein